MFSGLQGALLSETFLGSQEESCSGLSSWQHCIGSMLAPLELLWFSWSANCPLVQNIFFLLSLYSQPPMPNILIPFSAHSPFTASVIHVLSLSLFITIIFILFYVLLQTFVSQWHTGVKRQLCEDQSQGHEI